MSVTLSETTKALFDANTYPIVATLNADGSPQTSVVWARTDGDTVIFSTTRGRVKERNIARDPRVSVTVFDLENPYRYVEVRGTAEVVDEGGRELIDELSQAYHGKPFNAEPESVRRCLVRVTPTRITGDRD
jgi:PPOX class probable F420-dependent enzyme